MYLHPGEWSHIGEARSIGAILGDMREIAALRAKAARAKAAVRIDTRR